ncbi:hypothetical protein DERF_011990 [Dermatophagoides farinae]|uniref:Uncharacterized protein n=1 Tax=Dermatophagoides farinae TaxID=6954 RepID=A0A922L323_DERFA|nr:hypothetical protein DERF_011990 [Dermatophagoides farinae]
MITMIVYKLDLNLTALIACDCIGIISHETRTHFNNDSTSSASIISYKRRVRMANQPATPLAGKYYYFVRYLLI